MKRFIVFALFALVSCFVFDAGADTGFTQDLQEYVMDISPGDVGVTALAISLTAVVPAVGDTVLGDSNKLFCVTETEFEDLKAKYKHLYILNVAFDAGERYQFISRRPTRDVIQALGNSADDSFKIADIMLKNMIVAGDMNAIDDGVVYSRTLELLTDIIKDGKKLFTKA